MNDVPGSQLERRLIDLTRRPRSFGLALAMVVPAMLHAASVSDLPDQIKAPNGEKLVLRTRGSGAQIYVCQQPPGEKPQWTLKAPEAQLRKANGKLIAHHYLGPTWKHNDGSEVSGKVAAKVAAPDPDAIPWLLVTATRHSGAGVFARVTSIQRLHTRGGEAPAATRCNDSALGTEARVAYEADYDFYAPGR